jgi:membrane-associated phospholipid phosphatase
MNPSWVRVVDLLYMAWFGLLFVFFFWASWSSARVLRQRALIAFLLMWIGAGTTTAWWASSAGPCYYGHVVAGVDPYEPLIARLDAVASERGGLKARFNQKGLWELRRADEWGYFAGISAMPSLHVAIAVLIALVAAQRSRLLGFLLALYAVVIQIGSVILAWHYAVDGYVGALLAVLCWKAAGALVREPALAATPFQSVEQLRLLPPAVKQSTGPPASTTI